MNTPFTPEFIMDQNLREIPKDPSGLWNHVENLKATALTIENPSERAAVLGEIGLYLRILGELDEAEFYLLESLDLISEHNLGLKREIQQMIRLAHVLQWQKEFTESTRVFDQILEVCRQDEDAEFYLSFALQHAGKNLFDQHRYEEALSLFEEALEIRTRQRAHSDLLESTKLAIQRTKELLGSDDRR
jgi:tetratricopeptide (TPR) repeat protein